jgi:hypothetical protein
LYADMDSFGYISRIAGFYGNSIFSFWQVFILASIVSRLTYVPTNSV